MVAVVPLALLHSSGRPAPPRRQGRGAFWLTRLLLLRAMAAIYLCAFLTSAFQSRAIFGSRGLMPAAFGSSGRPTPVFTALESHAGWAFDDCQLELVSWLGVLLSLLQLCGTVVSCALPAALWVLYLSIVNCGGIVINYGWEWLTLEAGFLLIFLTPLCSSSPFPAAAPPSRLVLWLFRCKPHDIFLPGSCAAVRPLRKSVRAGLAFRLMIGAGVRPPPLADGSRHPSLGRGPHTDPPLCVCQMSKVGGNSSDCWQELSCTTTHYFTQPMPNPLAWWAHQMPEVRTTLEPESRSE